MTRTEKYMGISAEKIAAILRDEERAVYADRIVRVVKSGRG